ncbi:conserved hypothetical protein [Paraburkholderia caribensis]|nr:conserved hypothetical protein [Paraburkholderia caribensis]
MLRAPTTTSPALPAMPDRNERAPLSEFEAALWVLCVVEDTELDPEEVENEAFWLKLLTSSAKAPGAAAISTPMNIPATTRVQAWVRFWCCIGLVVGLG